MPPFIHGLDLATYFFLEVVSPILAANYPDLVYSAGLVGAGSEVLGYDTEQSTDHDWGPRLMIFLSDADHAWYATAVREILNQSLPSEFRGYDIFYALSGLPNRIEHHVEILTLRSLLNRLLGIEPETTLVPGDWLSFPQQRLLELTAGRIFQDGLGRLAPLRTQFSYYPRDIWLYLLAAQWRRIEQEEPFMGRAGFVDDELGSRIIAARLVTDIMRLAFFMEKQYTPYAKWFGTAFSRLNCGAKLEPLLKAVIDAKGWKRREYYLTQAYQYVATMHNVLHITDPLPEEVAPFYDRPYRIIQADLFYRAIREQIKDEHVLRLPAFLGSVDQVTNSTDVAAYPSIFRELMHLYEKP